MSASLAPDAVSYVMKQAPLGRPVAKSRRSEMGLRRGGWRMKGEQVLRGDEAGTLRQSHAGGR